MSHILAVANGSYTTGHVILDYEMDTSEYPDNVEPGKDEVWLVISFTVLFNYALALFADCSCPGPGFLPWGKYCPPILMSAPTFLKLEPRFSSAPPCT